MIVALQIVGFLVYWIVGFVVVVEVDKRTSRSPGTRAFKADDMWTVAGAVGAALIWPFFLVLFLLFGLWLVVGRAAQSLMRKLQRH